MTSEELHNIFFIECDESLGAAEAGLEACQTGTHDTETINAIFRAVHSIKGGAGAFGFAPLQSFTHCFETLLSDVRDGTVDVSDQLVDLMLRALDLLSDHVTAARESSPPPDDAMLQAELAQAQAGSAAGPADTTAADIGAGETDQIVQTAPAPLSAVQDDDDLDFDLDALLDDLADDAPGDEGEKPRWFVNIRPHDGAMANGSEPLLLLRELAELGGECIECDLAGLPSLELIDLRQGYLGWSYAMPGDVSQDAVREIFDFIGDDCSLTFGEKEAIPPIRERVFAGIGARAEAVPDADVATNPKDAEAAKAPPASKAANAVGQSIRIDLARLDQLIDSVGELVIAHSMLTQRLGASRLSNVEELATVETLVRDVQEKSMAFRAQPIGSAFARMPRLMRELAASTGKHVKLEVSGEATELDKSVIERLSEPLTHLIRNAVDHGIEGLDERLAAGKHPEGVLRLSAEHRAGRIIIRIADDGRGIDRDKVFAKAVKQGLIAPNAVMADEEIDNLIFAPGFSTAEQVSNVSGRGVGMDVVRQNVKELGGRISIESQPGKGTTFILALPLTLAISDGMIVRVGDLTLVIPLAQVVESVQPAAADLKGMGVDRQMLNVRGQFIPVVRLHTSMGAIGEPVDPLEAVLVVVDTESSGQAALLVDAINDQRQFVIKSLDKHYCAVEGVAGATIMGDGRVALILDVDQLVAAATTEPHREIAA